MNARESQKTGRLRLRHLMEHTEAVDFEMAEERQRFARLANDDAKPRVVSAFNLFQTPAELAVKLVGMFDSIGRTLEPSAGLGRIYRAIREYDPLCDVTLVDNDRGCCGELFRITEDDKCCRLIQDDFLSCTTDRLGMFDSIAMNPPFKQGTDAKHIMHAKGLLAPGGRLVALCANGPRQREKLKPIANQWIELPPDSFKVEGTRVNVAMLVIDN